MANQILRKISPATVVKGHGSVKKIVAGFPGLEMYPDTDKERSGFPVDGQLVPIYHIVGEVTGHKVTGEKSEYGPSIALKGDFTAVVLFDPSIKPADNMLMSSTWYPASEVAEVMAKAIDDDSVKSIEIESVVYAVTALKSIVGYTYQTQMKRSKPADSRFGKMLLESVEKDERQRHLEHDEPRTKNTAKKTNSKETENK